VAAFNVILARNSSLSAISLYNAEALSSVEQMTSESIWYIGMKTGEHTVGNKTFPCCVYGEATDACDYGRVGCAYFGN
jgi:hypothetical protein